MAKASSKKSTKKVQRHYPVQRTIQLRDQTAVVAGGRYLMGSQILSASNRRLYRQSRVYSMKIDAEIGGALALAGVEVYVLRDTWDLHGAYRYAMEMYYNAMKEELQAAGAQTRWHDFRVLSDFQSDSLIGTTNSPHPSSPTMNSGEPDSGDIEFSQVVDQAGNSRVFSLDSATTSATQFGIIREFNRKDQVQLSPSQASGDLPYDGLNPGMDEANYDLLRTRGESPPYGVDADINLWRKVGTIKEGPSGSTKLSTGFFDAPLGIVVLVSTGFTSGAQQVHDLHVTFQSGDYKGVKAPAYATPVLTPENKYEVV